jgi:hypothetical protein
VLSAQLSLLAASPLPVFFLQLPCSDVLNSLFFAQGISRYDWLKTADH